MRQTNAAVRARGAALLAAATYQISQLTGLLSSQGDAALARPCPGRAKLGDGTVRATTAHSADNYHRIAAFVRATVDGSAAYPTRRHDGEHQAENWTLSHLLDRLSAARDALAPLDELADEQLDLVPAASEMKFCDGRRTLEQIVTALLDHQRHQVSAVKTALDESG
jgi:hypothetical protein